MSVIKPPLQVIKQYFTGTDDYLKWSREVEKLRNISTPLGRYQLAKAFNKVFANVNFRADTKDSMWRRVLYCDHGKVELTSLRDTLRDALIESKLWSNRAYIKAINAISEWESENVLPV